MRQKTFVLNPSIRYIKRGGRMSEMVSNKPVNVGDVGILVCCEHVPSGRETWYLYDGDGFPGNANPEIRRYHGWRGQTGNESKTAYGLRKVISVRKIGGETRVTVGCDLHPDWD